MNKKQQDAIINQLKAKYSYCKGWEPDKVTKPEYNYYCQCVKCKSYNIWQIEPIIYPCDIPEVQCFDCGHIMSIAESYDYANAILFSEEDSRAVNEIREFNEKDRRTKQC